MARPPLRATSAQRGAAVFVVMMAILLLSGMGMWAMRSASLVDRASGYERASLQAQYVSELGLVATSSYLSLPNMAAVNFRLGERGYSSGDRCESIPTGMPTGVTSFCKSLWQKDIENNTITTLASDSTAEGSFSPFANEVQGDFTVEMTSPRRAIVPGSPLTEDSPYRLVTLTSYGTVRPHTGNAVNGNLCTASATSSAPENSAAGRIAVRSHAIIGPVE
jgi:Tfp pilus assembly protein PilX